MFWPIREEVQLGDFVAFLYEVVFLIDRGIVVARPVQREDSCEEFQEQIFNEAEEIANCNVSTRKQYSSIKFHGGIL